MKLALMEDRPAAAADAITVTATAKQPEPLEPSAVASAPGRRHLPPTFQVAMTVAAEAAPGGGEPLPIEAIDAELRPAAIGGGQSLKVPTAKVATAKVATASFGEEHAGAEATTPQPVPPAAFIALQTAAPSSVIPANLLPANDAPRSEMQAAPALPATAATAAAAQSAQLLSASVVAARFLIASHRETGPVQARALNVAHEVHAFVLSSGRGAEVATQDTPAATVPAAPQEASAPFVPVATASSIWHEAPTFTAANAQVLRLPAARPSEWAQPLAQALGDRLRLQVGARSESAVIRLDPPMLGQVEITVRHEAGSIQVQLNATHAEVRQQLQHIGESLRHDLSVRHAGDVSVTVGDGDAKDREREWVAPSEDERTPGAGLGDAGTGRHFELSGS